MSAKGLENWDLLPDGQVLCDILIDAGVAAISPHHVVLRLDFASSEEMNRKGHQPRRRRVQVSIEPKAAAEMAELLLRYSRGLERSVPSRDKQN